ncbi:Transcription elongation factor greA [Candidatus Westeberhardia cardiocondylae]|uniref:Transcription elongation factor GreA n=2 Tax=Candidatus Westeberhardia cardiocondylae TaxID=1594731 RepID=A0A0H5C5C7_9ENTR|nr:Transcription elongation factor greA [Candidatus Westeberhardia cardiocondylae]
MTLQGLEKLRKELEYLKNVRRSQIIEVLTESRKHGDLKENSEYHSAREQQAFCEGRIQEIESKLSHAQVIDVTKIIPSKKVIFGVTVSIDNLCTKEKRKYRIVGDDEADFRKNLISINSPIARGLVGRKEGDTVVIKTPRGNVKYKILKVEYI